LSQYQNCFRAGSGYAKTLFDHSERYQNLNRNLVEISPYAENTQKLVNLWMSMFENWLLFG
jgi:hypothetical protein